MKEMSKPILPVEPNIKHYKRDNVTLKLTQSESERWTNDYRKYQRDLEKYKKDIVIFEQIRFIKKIKNTCLESCLKKYTITKK